MSAVDEIEEFFKVNGYPDPPVHFDQCTTIIDPKKFTENHIATIRRYEGEKKNVFVPYLNRLIKFHKICLE